MPKYNALKNQNFLERKDGTLCWRLIKLVLNPKRDDAGENEITLDFFYKHLVYKQLYSIL